VRFWFAAIDPLGLHAVRLLAGLLFLAWLLAFAGNQEAFFGLGGWFDRQAYLEASRLPGGTPAPVSWSVLYLAGTDSTILSVLYWLSVAVVALFTLGVWPRLTGVLTWVVVASFTANPAIAYDADSLLVVLAFYLMIGYLLLGLLDGSQPPLARLLGPLVVWIPGRRAEPPRESVAANLALRLLQVHVALVLCVSGLHKLQFSEWWGGVNFWYALYPPLETTVAQAREHMGHARAYLSVLSLGAYLALAWQIGFPLFAWRPRWRAVLLGGAAAGWLATALLYHLPLFGPAFFIGALCFLSPAEWRRLAGWLPAALHRVDELRHAQKEAVRGTATASRTR
jgi:hypothetical protein